MTLTIRPPANPPSIDIPERLGYRIKRRVLGQPLVTARLHEEKLKQEGRARRAVQRLHLLLRVRHRRDADRAAGGLRPDRLPHPAADDRRRARRADPDDAVLPRGRHGLHQGRRVLRRGAGELRAARSPRSLGRAADRLHRHRRGAGRGRHGRDHLAGAGAAQHEYTLAITIGVVLLLAYGNLRGVREAGKAFALPDLLLRRLRRPGRRRRRAPRDLRRPAARTRTHSRA